jgi:DNA-binding beta-propeller fold protein YncE
VFDRDLNHIDTVRVTPQVGSLSYVQSTGVNTAGTRAYVDVVDWDAPGDVHSFSVIDTTTNTEIAVIAGRTTALSPDGSRRYVLQADGRTVNVYNNATSAVLGSFTTDQNASTGARSIAVAADGKVYVADAADNKVYVVTVGTIPSSM